MKLINEIKTKISNFYHKHENAIMFVGTVCIFAGVTGLYGYFVYKDAKESEKRHEMAMAEIDWQHSKNMTEIDSLKECVSNIENNKLEDDPFEARKKNPKYQLANGGWITDDYEMCGWECPDGQQGEITEMIINDLPIGNMGVFGEDICKKLDELYPNHKPITDVSMTIDLRSDPTFGKKEENDEQNL